MVNKTINALERGLTVLRCLEENSGKSLAAIHQTTGIPKPSLLRILETLEKNRFAWRAIGDGHYRRSISLATQQRFDEQTTRIAEVAAPFLEQLQRKVLWPSDILVCRNNRLELVETSRRQSNLGLTFYRIGFQVDMFLSAPGRAYLAFCKPEERTAILAHARDNPPTIARSRAVLTTELADILDATRLVGYGSRDPQFGGSAADIAEVDDGLDAIAVPILRAGRVLACMNLVWPRKYKLKAKIVADHLGDLQQTAQAIADACDPAANVPLSET